MKREKNISEEVGSLLRFRNLSLRKTGNLFQIVHASLGSVFQHHNIYGIRNFLRHEGSYLTLDIPFCNEIDDRICAVKYGKIRNIK